MFMIASIVCVYLLPILTIIFCLNLVSIIKKVKTDEKTTTNTFWLTFSFTIMIWSIALLLINLII